MTCRWCGGQLTGIQQKWCSERCRKRAWDDEHARANCTECGTRLGPGAARRAARRGGMRCCVCDRAYRTSVHETRLSVIEGCWLEGWPVADIAEVYGRTNRDAAAIGPELDELFNAGRIQPRRVGYQERRDGTAGHRDDYIAWAYNEGHPLRDIAADVSLDSRTASSIVCRLRRSGRIGYRYRVENGRRLPNAA